MKPKKNKKPLKTKVPKALSAEETSRHLNCFDETPAEFWSGVESTWEWVKLRRGGKLTERLKALDDHFLTLSKTHRVCPVILLLNRGARE